MPLEDFEDMIKKCLRCSVCKWIPQIQIQSQKYATACPSIDRYNFHSYSGGGRITKSALMKIAYPYLQRINIEMGNRVEKEFEYEDCV